MMWSELAALREQLRQFDQILNKMSNIELNTVALFILHRDAQNQPQVKSTPEKPLVTAKTRVRPAGRKFERF